MATVPTSFSQMELAARCLLAPSLDLRSVQQRFYPLPILGAVVGLALAGPFFLNRDKPEKASEPLGIGAWPLI